MELGYILGAEEREHADGGCRWRKGKTQDDPKISDVRRRHSWVPLSSVGKARESVVSKMLH